MAGPLSAALPESYNGWTMPPEPCTNSRPTTPKRLSPMALGTACCMASALGYTASNVCMRQLSQLLPGYDWAMWTICNRELVSVVVMGPWLVWAALRWGLPRVPLRGLGMLILVSVAVQLGANLGLQWSFGVVGLAVAVPAIFSLMIIASAVMGRVLLGEPISRRTSLAIGLLLVALLMLGAATYVASGSGRLAAGSAWRLALGIGAPCLAGTIYALLTITIRHTVTREMPLSVVVFVTTAMGVVCLGPLSIARLGLPELQTTTPGEWAWMLSAGTFNLLAFLAIVKGLQLTTAVHANMLNATQVAMGAIAGLVGFGEQVTVWLVLGVALTVVGVVLIDRPDDKTLADQHA